jgi:hypothetical protein
MPALSKRERLRPCMANPSLDWGFRQVIIRGSVSEDGALSLVVEDARVEPWRVRFVREGKRVHETEKRDCLERR